MSQAPMPTFAGQMDVEAKGNGRYEVELDPRWNCPISTHGGTATAIAISAIASELDLPTSQLRTVSTTYEAPVGPGPATIDVQVLRRGRSVAQVMASMRSADAPAGLTSIAVFGAPRVSYEFFDSQMPDVVGPGPIRTGTTPDPDTGNAYWEPGSADNRLVLGSYDNTDPGPGDSVNARWLRFDVPPMEDGLLNPLAAVAFGDVMPTAVAMRMGSEFPFSILVSADYTFHQLGPARSEWLLSVNRAHGISDGYASVESTLWDEHGSLVGFATGILIQSFPQGAPELLRPKR